VKQRRSLTHVGGDVRMAGDAKIAEKLAEALDVQPAPTPGEGAMEGDDPDRAHVHGFHTYPARMHPVTAARLVAALSERGATLLDPFCGSGTVLVEAMIAGRAAVGTDLNPLAYRLARLKTSRLDAREREGIASGAKAIAAFADARRERRAGATHRYPREDVDLFDPHILLELDSIHAAIGGHGGSPRVRDALELVMSAILVKVSRRASDTSLTVAPRRLAAGYTTRLFVRKADELVERVAELENLIASDVSPGRVELDNASRLRLVAASTIDAVVTSPPYVGTYDYVEHHALRMRWLDLDPRAFSTGEIGSRRRYDRLAAGGAREAWSRELGDVLRALSRVCRKGATVGFVVADSAVLGEALLADKILTSVAAETGFVFRARASQDRPHFHGPTARAFEHAPRAEHAIALEKG
jgi:DNA modification methylase